MEDSRQIAGRWVSALLAGLLGGGWLVSLFAPLLRPGWALGNRDVAAFHLPLRSTFRDLAAFGLPRWNPWVHGGQPILSNPSYGTFYPLSWLVLLAPADYALTVMVLVHWTVAFAGAWFLARHLGCGRATAALAGVGYSGCGAYVSLLSAMPLFFGMAWLPWVLAWGDAAFRRPPGESWRRPAVLAAMALALQLLNGDPSAFVMSGIALAALAVSAAGRRPKAGLRLAVPIGLALAIAAVQLLPALHRLPESPRRSMPLEYAVLLSLPPQRLAEPVFPRAFGDSARALEGRYFGWKVNDNQFPYVESLYPGLLILVLGVSFLIRGGIPRRAAWALCCLSGLALALGRHDPVFGILRRLVPGLATLRFPERFAILAVLALALAGLLAWQRLLDERQAGRPAAADLPLALTVVVLTTALGLALVLWLLPGLARGWIVANGAPRLPPQAQVDALLYLRRESLAAVATASAVMALLALCRWRRPSRRLLEGLAIILLSVDLWHYGHELPRTVPVSFYRQPPPLAASLLPPRDRLYVERFPAGFVEPLPPGGDLRLVQIRTFLGRLQPYSALLWRIPYAFDVDFELMLTEWGRRADRLLQQESDPQGFFGFLGAWNVGTALLPRARPDQAPASADFASRIFHRVTNPLVLPRFRFVPAATFQPSFAAAVAAARAERWQVARHEQWVRPGRPPETLRYSRRPRLLEVSDRGGQIDADYQAEEAALFVAAMTFDPGWSALLDGKPLPVYATAACQLGVALPAGRHRLLLRYREPLFAVGAAVTLTTLAAAAAALFVGRRRGTDARANRRGPGGTHALSRLTCIDPVRDLSVCSMSALTNEPGLRRDCQA